MSYFRKVAAALAATAAVAMPGTAEASQVKLGAELGSAAFTAEKGKRIYLRIGLEGLALAGESKRMPVNVGLVIDRSGSMEDENKIGKAREAAIMALGRLGAGDYASVVAFNHEVGVLMPATRVLDHIEIVRSIEKLTADGNTALYAGTDQGIREVEKFLAKNQVNRVILISDGLANVGPSTPGELAELGRRAGGKGITISTIGLGLGYNEDLMTKLAYSSDGNHAFVERADQLVDIFNKEFGDALSIVAQELIIKIECGDGFKPIRALGREATIENGTVTLQLNQIAGRQQKYAVIELEVPASVATGDVSVADIELSYRGMGGQSRESVRTKVTARITEKAAEEQASLNKEAMGDISTQLANEVHEEAIQLRDEGKVEDAKKLLNGYAASLESFGASSGVAAAAPIAKQFREDAEMLDSDADWNRTRKSMRAYEHKNKVQQSY